jgi:hypothetical protein
MRITMVESKADSPLLVDADAELSLPVAIQRVQTIRGRKPQVGQHQSRIQLPESVQGFALNFTR